MPFELETIKQKEEQIISDVDSATGQTTPPLEISWNRIFARAQAGMSKLFDKLAQASLRDVFLSTTQNLSILLEWSKWTKTPQVDATQAILNVTGSGIPSETVTGGLSGVQFISEDGQKFYFAEDLLIPITGIIDTQITAFLAGAQANLYTGVLSITAQSTVISDKLTIKESDPIHEAGTEPESIDEWRSEMQRVAQKPVTSDNYSYYYSVSRQIDHIIAGYAYVRRPSQLDLYIETDSLTGIPTATEIAEVEDYFDGTTDGIVRLPAGMEQNLPDDATTKRFRVFASEREEFHADVSALLPDTADNRTAVDTAIKTYFDTLKPYIKGVSIENEGKVTQQALRSVVQGTIETIGADSFHDVTFKKVSTGIVYSTYPLVDGKRVYANDTEYI